VTEGMCNAFGVIVVTNANPGCAALRRPWALECNAFGVKQMPKLLLSYTMLAFTCTIGDGRSNATCAGRTDTCPSDAEPMAEPSADE